MSDNKRSRKYSNLKENKRKNDEVEPPKILLKPKAAASSPSISIATRDPAAATTGKLLAAASSAAAAGVNPLSASIASSIATTSASSAYSSSAVPNSVPFKPLSAAASASSANNSHHPTGGPFASAATSSRDSNRDLQPPAVAIATDATDKSPKMSAPLQLINDHLQLDTAALAHHLHDANTHFFVVGVIGPQGVGKSTLLNMLQSADDIGKTALHEHFIHCHGGIFATRRSAAQQNSAQPTTDGVQLYITGDRLLLLDAAPVLCNPQRKDAAASELDDLRLVAFMLSVCHTVLVVDSGGVHNLAMLRLLQMGELLKPSLDLVAATATTSGCKQLAEQLVVERGHFPAVMFVQNLAEHWPAGDERIRRLRGWYANVFAQSNMRMFGGNVRARDVAAAAAEAAAAAASATEQGDGKRSSSSSRQTPLNWFAFPRATVVAKTNGTSVAARNQMDMTTVVQQFRRWVLMAPRTRFGGAAAAGFSERNWSQLVATVWESHKSSYFLRKYETDIGSRNGAQ